MTIKDILATGERELTAFKNWYGMSKYTQIGNPGHFPLNSALRFSRNAFMPSF